MDYWIQLFAQHELLYVFLVCFFGATLLPLPTEAAILGALALHESVIWVWVIGSIGNMLGATTNYWLGAKFEDWTHNNLNKSKSGRKALAWFHQYGKYSMLASWMPIVGDPLCFSAGLFRLERSWFVIGLFTRAVRYLVVIAGFRMLY